MEKSIEQSTSNGTLLKYVVSALILTTLVFYIDEGAYNFDWTTNIGSWIVFVIYAAFVLFGQALFAHFLLKKKFLKSRNFISIIGGALFGLALAIMFFILV